MKKVLIPLLFLLILLSSCANSKKKINIIIEGDVASPSFPIKIQVKNINNYTLKFFDENGLEIKTENTGDNYYFKNLKTGKNKILINVFSENKKIYEKAVKIFFDNVAPNIAFLNYYMKDGMLNITASSPATDLKNFILKTDDKQYTFNINLKIPISKNSGIIDYKLYAEDKYNNISKEKIIEIDTNKDEKPKIINNDLKISLFGETNIKVYDDWTPEEDLKILLKTDKKSYSIINIDEVLLEDTKEGTLIVIDNGNNITQKKINISVEKNLPSIPSGNPRLIDYSVDTFGWNYETDVDSYVVETPYKYGWKTELESKAAYARILDANVAMIRKKSKYGTLSYPSQPTIRFSGNFVHLVRNILESSEDNLYLPQINSEFLIGGKTVLGENSVVMVESGSVLKFVSNSQLVIKGLFFIMPGPGKSLISGNGEIIVDGGILIASKTILDKVNIIGKNAKLIYLEDSEFLEGSDLLSSNDFRICLYNTLGYKNNLNFHNTEEIYIKNSSFNNLNFQNVNIFESEKSSFSNMNIDGLTNIYLNNTTVKSIKQHSFSWSKILNSYVDNLELSGYSRSVLYKSNITNISTDTSVVIK